MGRGLRRACTTSNWDAKQGGGERQERKDDAYHASSFVLLALAGLKRAQPACSRQDHEEDGHRSNRSAREWVCARTHASSFLPTTRTRTHLGYYYYRCKQPTFKPRPKKRKTPNSAHPRSQRDEQHYPCEEPVKGGVEWWVWVCWSA